MFETTYFVLILKGIYNGQVPKIEVNVNTPANVANK